MPFPVFISEVRAAATDTVQAGAGSVQTIPATQYYFYTSSKASAGDGKGLLWQLIDSANASSGVTWTFTLDANLKLKVTHNSGGAVNLILGRGLAWNLGFPLVFATAYPPDPTLTITTSVPSGAGGYTVPYRSPWLWCPERLISSVGPELFDPAIGSGIKSAMGSAARAPDSTVSAVTSPVLTEASFTFLGVNPLWRARHTDFNYADTHEREDFETWWQYGPRLGRRFLFVRNKASVSSAGIFGIAGAVAPPYVEYYPTQAMMNAPQVKASVAGNLVYHDITVSGWLTERGDAIY